MTIIRNTVPLPEPPAMSTHGHIPGLEFPRSEADDTRASIVDFLNAERQKFERAHAEHIATRRSVVDYRRREYDDKTLRLDVQVTLINALLASIERGDDMGPR